MHLSENSYFQIYVMKLTSILDFDILMPQKSLGNAF